ncbi:MAG: hypothetical protein KGH77_03240 [Candidatus Micrarchaeota archaeon]|nr:hypothetical protein [Candidatus Micrarchaeota archaeon]MDE1864415.1 hypothetical protein [Candidatus Micrarchaeota archaeon]
MEGRVANNEYKIAVVGSPLLATGSKLAGIPDAFTVSEPEEIEGTMRTLMQKEEIGIIVITERSMRKIRDRKLIHAIDTSLRPLIIDVPDYNEPEKEADALRRLILRAIGIDINKMSKR